MAHLKSLYWICYNIASVLCFLFFFFFGQEACGILALWPRIEPEHSALEGEVLTTRPLGKSLSLGFYLCFLNDIWCRTLFHMLICHPYIFFAEVKWLFRSLAYFYLVGWFAYCWVLRVLYIFRTPFYQIHDFKYFLQVYCLSFHSVNVFFTFTK